MGRPESITHYHFAASTTRPKFTICIMRSLVSVTMQILFLSSIQVYTSFVLSNICSCVVQPWYLSTERMHLLVLRQVPLHTRSNIKERSDLAGWLHLVSSFAKRSTRWRHESTTCVSQFGEFACYSRATTG